MQFARDTRTHLPDGLAVTFRSGLIGPRCVRIAGCSHVVNGLLRRRPDGAGPTLTSGAMTGSTLAGDALPDSDGFAGDTPGMRALMAKYRDLPMDLADAALVRVAERERIRKVFTTTAAPCGSIDPSELAGLPSSLRPGFEPIEQRLHRVAHARIEGAHCIVGRIAANPVPRRVNRFTDPVAQSRGYWDVRPRPDRESPRQ